MRRLLRFKAAILLTLSIAIFTSQLRADANGNCIAFVATITKFVAPVSPTVVTELEALSHVASRLLPESELPQRDWLLDASEPPKLALHEPSPVNGPLGEEVEGDAFTVALIVVMLVVVVIATLVTAVGILAAHQTTYTQNVAEAEAEKVATTPEAEAFAAAYNAENTPAVEAEAYVEAVEAEIEETDDTTTVAEAYLAAANATDGQGAIQSDEYKQIAVKRVRTLMLSLELDTTLASMAL